MCCVAIWVLAHLFHLPNHLGWGHDRFNGEYYLCSFDISTHSYAIFYIVMGVLVPLMGVLYGYTAIFLKVRSVKSSLRSHQAAVMAAASVEKMSVDRLPLSTKNAPVQAHGPKGKRPAKPGFTQDDVKLAKTLFAAFLVFLVCWLPLALFVLAHEPEEIPSQIYLIAIILAHGNSAVNPILYGMTNEKFRDGYRNVIGLSQRTGVVINEGADGKSKRYMATENFTSRSQTNDSGAVAQHKDSAAESACQEPGREHKTGPADV